MSKIKTKGRRRAQSQNADHDSPSSCSRQPFLVHSGDTRGGPTSSAILFEETPKNRRNFADHTPQACATLAQLPIQLGSGSVRGKDFLKHGTMLFEAMAVRVSLVRPMREKSRTHGRQSPQPPAVLKPRDIVVVRIGSPNPALFHPLLDRRHPNRPTRRDQASCARSRGSLRLSLGTRRSAGAGTTSSSEP